MNNFYAVSSLLESIKNGDMVDYETGEGIYWRRVSPLEAQQFKSLNLEWEMTASESDE